MVQLLAPLIRYLDDTRARAGTASLSDADLLELFLRQCDEDAFATLVRRHGPMVLGVCRRVTRHHHDAEDTFQAVFLTLAQRGGSIRKGDSLGSWLHGVALRLARKARSSPARRVLLGGAPERPAPEAESDADVREVLDEEIARLPAHYRAPVVLCYLEGRSNEEAARTLGCPLGTVQSRLARARARLAKTLARRGIGLGAVLPAPALPAGWAGQTARAALLWASGRGTEIGPACAGAVRLLTEGGKTMTAKVKLALALVLVLGPLGSAGALLERWPAAPAEVRAEEAPRAAKGEAAEKPAHPPAPKAAPEKPKEEDSRLEEVLRRWARAQEEVKSFRRKVRRTMNDKTLQVVTVAEGEAVFVRPCLLRVDFQVKGKPVERFVFTEREVHFYDFDGRTVRVLPRAKDLRFPGGGAPSLAGWLRGEGWAEAFESLYWLHAEFPVRELRRHVTMQLVKEDRWYIYLELRPRPSASDALPKRLRVVLLRDGYVVRQLWYEEPNGNEVTLDFERPQAEGPLVTPESLAPKLPAGWKRLNWPVKEPDEDRQAPRSEGEGRK